MNMHEKVGGGEERAAKWAVSLLKQEKKNLDLGTHIWFTKKHMLFHIFKLNRRPVTMYALRMADAVGGVAGDFPSSEARIPTLSKKRWFKRTQDSMLLYVEGGEEGFFPDLQHFSDFFLSARDFYCAGNVNEHQKRAQEKKLFACMPIFHLAWIRI